MTSEEIFDDLSAIFHKRLAAVIDEEAYTVNEHISKEDYRNNIFNDIIFLGFHDGNIADAAAALYHEQAAIHGESKELKEDIEDGLDEAMEYYDYEVAVFIEFYKMYNEDATKAKLLEFLNEKFQ